MTQPVTLKVYGNLYPADAAACSALSLACAGCLPENDAVTALDGDILRISFEGVYFPLEEVLAAIRKIQSSQTEGKLDVLDLDEWTLSRYFFKNGLITHRVAPLNNVLDYSGH